MRWRCRNCDSYFDSRDYSELCPTCASDKKIADDDWMLKEVREVLQE